MRATKTIRSAIAACIGLVAALFATPAAAQSACSYIAYGVVLTSAQWNQCFAAKNDVLGYVPINKAGDVLLGKLVASQSNASSAGFNLPQGAAPSSPQNGDVWTTLLGVFARINGVTVGPFGSISGANFAATAPLAVNFVGSLGTFSINLDANFAVSGGNLALASIASGNLLANAGSSSAEPAGTPLTALLDRAFGSTRGSLVERGASGWSSVPPGTAGLPYVSNGSGADPAYQQIAGAGIAAATIANANLVNPSATVNGQTCILGSTCTVAAAAGTLTGTTLNATVVSSSLTSVGTLTGGGTASGFTIALGSSTITGTLPLTNGGAGAGLTASNGGIVYSNAATLAVLAGTPSAGQCLLSGASAPPSWGSCSGAASVSSVSNADGTLTISPTTGAVVASLALGHANTWTAAQTFPASGILLAGSSTGLTTLASANAGASNFTVTIPAATDTLVNLAGAQTMSNKTFVAPVLGAATATSINGNTFTAGTYTLTGASGKTLTFSNSITLAGSDGTTWSGASANMTLAALNLTGQNLSGGATVTPNNLAAGTSFTVNCGLSPLQWIVNSGAFTITPPAASASQNCAVRVINGTNASNAGAITLAAGWSGKTPGGTFSSTPTVSAAAVSFTNSSATIGWTTSTPGINSIVFFATTGGLPTGFAANTLYYVVASTAATSVQVSATPGGSAITAGSAGSGTQTGYVPSVFDLVVENINSPPYAQWVQVQ